MAPEQGVTRCLCGCKYWEGGRCIDCGERPTPEPATLGQVAEARRLAALVPDWADRLNGEAWERTFDLIEDGSKFVSRIEARAAIDALAALVP